MASYDPKRMERLLCDMERPKGKKRSSRRKNQELEGAGFGSLVSSVFKTVTKYVPKAVTKFVPIASSTVTKGISSGTKALDSTYIKALAPITTSSASRLGALGAKTIRYGNYIGIAAGVGLPIYQGITMAADAKKAKEDEAKAAAAEAQALIDQAANDKLYAESMKKNDDEKAAALAQKKYWEEQQKLADEAYKQSLKQQDDAAADAILEQRKFFQSQIDQAKLDAAEAQSAALALQQQTALELANFYKQQYNQQNSAYTQPTTTIVTPTYPTVPITTGPTPSYPTVPTPPKPPSSTGRRGRGMVGGISYVSYDKDTGTYRKRGGPVNIVREPIRKPTQEEEGAYQAAQQLDYYMQGGPDMQNYEGVIVKRPIKKPRRPVQSSTEPRFVSYLNSRLEDEKRRGIVRRKIDIPKYLIDRAEMELPPAQPQFSTHLPVEYQPVMTGSGKKLTKAAMVSDMVHYFGVSKAEAKRIIKMHNL